MNGEIITYDPPVPVLYQPPQHPSNRWIDILAPAAELAKTIANTEFVPDALRGKPAAITACFLYGQEIGIGPMQSLAKVDIVKGRPAPRAELARALANAAGHEVWVEESTNTRVTVCGRRRGQEHLHRVTWTLDDAKKAGLAGNPNYNKYPRQMLLARASAELVRMMAPEVLGGIGVFAEEADDSGVDAGPVVEGAPAEQSSRKRKRVEVTHTPEPVEPPALPEAPGVELVSDAQIKKMMAAMTSAGITARDDRLKFVNAAQSHQVGSSKELTRDEASVVIDRLEGVEQGEFTIQVADDGAWSLVPQGVDAPPLPEDV